MSKRSTFYGLCTITAVSIFAFVAHVPMSAGDDATVMAGANPFFSPLNTAQMVAPAFQMNSAQGLTNLYGQCFANSASTDALTQQLMNIASGGKSTTAKKNGSCGTVDVKGCVVTPVDTNISCRLSWGDDGDDSSFDEIAFQKLLNSANQSECCALAKYSQLKQAQSELSCIDSQTQLLQQQIQSLQATFKQQLDQAQSAVSQIDSTVSDRMQQTQFLAGKLGDDKSGLLAMQAQLGQLMASQIPDQEKQLEDANTIIQQHQIDLPKFVAARRMSLAQQCFTTQLKYKCSTNAAGNCSLADYVLAKYYEQARTSNGSVDRSGGVGSSTSQASAKSQQGALQALLNQIFSDMPDIAAPQPGAVPVYGLLNPQAIEQNYGTQLSNFNTGGFNVHDAVIYGFNQCYNQILNKDDMAIDAQVNGLNKEINDAKKSANNFMTQYADVYSKIWDAFGQTGSLNLSKCQDSGQTQVVSSSTTGATTTSSSGNSVAYSQQLQCARDLMTNLQGLWNGNTANSMVTINVKASSQTNQFSFSCYGINGCVTKMKNAVENLHTETQRLEQYKRSYIQQANTSIDQFKTQMTQALSAQSQLLSQRLQQLKGTLASAGLTDQLTFPPIQKGDMTKAQMTDSTGDYDGLYAMPDDLLAVIGGGLTPPLPDPSQNSFDQARASISNLMQQDDQQAKQIADQINQLKGSADSCRKSLAAQKKDNALAAVQTLVNTCQKTSYLCDRSSSLSELQSSIQQMTGSVAADLDSILSSGTGACGDLEITTATKDLESAKTALAMCKGECAYEKSRVDDKENAVHKAVSAYRPPASCPQLNTKANKAVRNLSSSDSDDADSTSAD